MISTKGRLGIAIVIILAIVVAVIVLYPHQVDISAEGNGTVEPSGENGIRFYQELTIDIVPDEGYRSKVYVDDILKAEDVRSFTFNVGMFDFSSHSVKVIFVKETPVEERYTLAVESTGDGSTTPTGSNIYDKGASVEVSIVPSDGNVIGSVSVDGVEVTPSNSVTILMDSDHRVAVVFRLVSSEDIPVTVTVDVDIDIVVETLGYSGDMDFGTVSPSGTIYIAPHGSLTVTVILNEGFEVKDFIVNGTSHGSVIVYTITDITKPVSVELSVVKKVTGFIITASAGTGGSISPSEEVKVAKGDDITFSFSPASGYKVSTLTVDGKTISTISNSYTFTDVQEAHSISVTFQSIGGSGGGGGGGTTKNLTGIRIVTPPTKTSYYVGEPFDPTGMVITASYSDGNSEPVVGYTFTPTEFLNEGQSTVTISYTEGEVTETCTVSVTVGYSDKVSVIVKEYSGTMVSGGSTTSFSETPNQNLESFTGYHLRNIVPGIRQTITLEITNNSTYGLDLSLYVKTVDSTEGLSKQIQFSGTSMEPKTLHDVLDGSYFSVGSVDVGQTTMVTFVVEFLDLPNNNEVMGDTLDFTLGILSTAIVTT